MGNQEMPSELPPMYINHDELEAVTSLCARYGGYGGYTGWEVAYRRECQLRAANERAEYLQGEHDYWQRLYRASEEERSELLARAEAAEAKLAAVSEHKE